MPTSLTPRLGGAPEGSVGMLRWRHGGCRATLVDQCNRWYHPLAICTAGVGSNRKWLSHVVSKNDAPKMVKLRGGNALGSLSRDMQTCMDLSKFGFFRPKLNPIHLLFSVNIIIATVHIELCGAAFQQGSWSRPDMSRNCSCA